MGPKWAASEARAGRADARGPASQLKGALLCLRDQDTDT